MESESWCYKFIMERIYHKLNEKFSFKIISSSILGPMNCCIMEELGHWQMQHEYSAVKDMASKMSVIAVVDSFDPSLIKLLANNEYTEKLVNTYEE